MVRLHVHLTDEEVPSKRALVFEEGKKRIWSLRNSMRNGQRPDRVVLIN
jgi:hypothetical protein